MVGAVGEVLALEANGTAAWEGGPMLSLVPVGPVVGIDLHTRLCGIDFHHASAHGIRESCGEGEFHLLFLVQHEAMVVACADAYLFVISINILP